MKLTLVTPPERLAVQEVDETWEHLKFDDLPTDLWYVRTLIESAIAELDGPNGLLGRALITQTWKLTLDKWPRVIELPLPPCQAVVSIAYADAAGATQTMPAADYRVSGLLPATSGGDFGAVGSWGSDFAKVAPVSWWPNVGNVSEPISVTFRAGYGDTPMHIPTPIRVAIMERVATLYANRESVAVGVAFSPFPASAMAGLEPYRLRAF